MQNLRIGLGRNLIDTDAFPGNGFVMSFGLSLSRIWLINHMIVYREVQLGELAISL